MKFIDAIATGRRVSRPHWERNQSVVYARLKRVNGEEISQVFWCGEARELFTREDYYAEDWQLVE